MQTVSHMQTSCTPQTNRVPQQDSYQLCVRETMAFLWPRAQDIELYMRLTRFHNTVPTLVLVFMGAWAGVGHSPVLFTQAAVWLVAVLCASEQEMRSARTGGQANALALWGHSPRM